MAFGKGKTDAEKASQHPALSIRDKAMLAALREVIAGAVEDALDRREQKRQPLERESER